MDLTSQNTFMQKVLWLIKQFCLWIALSFTFAVQCFAIVKEVGVPVIQNFQREVYGAGTQNWSVCQGDNGMVYFGNNNGLICFDGKSWNLYALPNGSNVRCVYFSSAQQRLYVGGFNDFGYFSNDSIGFLKYTSLKNLIPKEYSEFGDVWRIHEGPWGIAFQSFSGIYFYDEGAIEVVSPRSEFHFSYYVNGNLYIFDRANGLMEYRNGFLKKIPGGDFFAGTEVWSVLPINNDELLIGTAKKGVFLYDGETVKPWNTPVNEILKKYQIYSSREIDENYIAFGTIQNGLVICDKQGKIQNIINREKGLQNNTILSMNLDLDGNLWLGLDNGIDYVEINSPITLMRDFYDFGTGYTSISFDGKVYLGTNQGLFYCDKEKFISPLLRPSDIQMVQNTSGQVWSLKVIENQLYCGHNNGCLLIKGTQGIQIDDTPGCWALNPIPGYYGYYVAGTYSGMELFSLKNGQMKREKHIAGINYSCQEMFCVDDRYVWVSHFSNGVSLYRLNESLDSLELLKTFTVADGLPAPFSNKVWHMKNDDVILTTDDGIYHYDKVTKNFYKSRYYNLLFDQKIILFLQEDQNNSIWYITKNNESGVLRFQEDGTYNNVVNPFCKMKGMFIGSFFNFDEIDEANVLIAIERGFAHYNPRLVVDYGRKYNTIISEVSCLNTNQRLFSGLSISSKNAQPLVEPEISYKNNALRFSFSSTFFEGNNHTHFSYKLEGFDEDWSPWQDAHVKEYTNLPDGNYRFLVRGENHYGVISESEPFVFSVLPPWYKSTKAYIVYFAIISIIVWISVNLLVRKLESSKALEREAQKKKFLEREAQLKREALEAEKEIIRLKNEHLLANVIHKDKELANTAMSLVQKNQFLDKIDAELKKILTETKDDAIKSRITSVINKIAKETSNDNSWNVFETNFEQVHEDFLKRIRILHPDITPKELKLAAYLRLNISTKEISTLMNVTPRGVEISRYRLRKKLNLDRQQSLIDYILSI